MDKQSVSRIVPIAVVLLMLTVAGCAGRKTAFIVPEGAGEKTVALEVSSFRFEPNAIEAHAGDRLLLRMHNSAVMGHNLTVTDPGGKILLAIDLPPGKTTEAVLALGQAGEYRFYCDKPMHTSMGMSGTITTR